MKTVKAKILLSDSFVKNIQPSFNSKKIMFGSVDIDGQTSDGDPYCLGAKITVNGLTHLLDRDDFKLLSVL